MSDKNSIPIDEVTDEYDLRIINKLFSLGLSPSDVQKQYDTILEHRKAWKFNLERFIVEEL